MRWQSGANRREPTRETPRSKARNRRATIGPSERRRSADDFAEEQQPLPKIAVAFDPRELGVQVKEASHLRPSKWGDLDLVAFASPQGMLQRPKSWCLLR